ncbi:MAG TPA: EAL domain-containing protein [Dongiaceae bacterium]|jgi:diguanylate cyclase (GGDEF)-like protein/PAS domain S-box-containing protein|nr:EAL domain-containing protein [Dongiaceae bacterium]
MNAGITADPTDAIIVAGQAPAMDELFAVLTEAGLPTERVTDLVEAEGQIEERGRALLILFASSPADETLRMVTRLRKGLNSATLPIVMLMAKGRQELMVRALETGADDCLEMPIYPPLVTARIRALMGRLHEMAEGVDQRQRFDLVVRGAGDGIWDWRLTDDSVYFSPRWRELLGYQPEDRFSAMEDWLALIHPEDSEMAKRELRNHVEGISLSFQVECRLRHKSQSYRWFLIRGTSQRDPYGHTTRMAGSLTDISERKLTDPMTGLPNRIVLYDRINQAIVKTRRRKNSSFGIILLQIDRYETMREAYGQSFCDNVQRVVAQRIAGILRMTDTLTIMSDTTLCILVDVMREDTDLVRVAQRVRAAAEEPVSLGEESVMLTLSIGMAQGSTHHIGADELIKDATAALNKARQSGAGHEAVFDPDMQRRARDRLRIEADLHQALRREELRVFWQPIVELGPNRLAGFEALLRWEHPSRGLISPLEFIPVAEESGLIVPIGKFVLREALRQASAWHAAGAPSDLFVSVNVSSRQLDSPDLVEAVTAALGEQPVPAGCLHIEITESAVMRDVARCQDVLKQLKALGCHMALDDFGTGYSSLSLLQRLPLDYVKIDRSFIAAMSGEFAGESMVGAIIQIARILHLTVIAEGIEAETDELRLRALGCQFGQGYRYGKPLPAPQWQDVLFAKRRLGVAQ